MRIIARIVVTTGIMVLWSCGGGDSGGGAAALPMPVAAPVSVSTSVVACSSNMITSLSSGDKLQRLASDTNIILHYSSDGSVGACSTSGKALVVR